MPVVRTPVKKTPSYVAFRLWKASIISACAGSDSVLMQTKIAAPDPQGYRKLRSESRQLPRDPTVSLCGPPVVQREAVVHVVGQGEGAPGIFDLQHPSHVFVIEVQDR